MLGGLCFPMEIGAEWCQDFLVPSCLTQCLSSHFSAGQKSHFTGHKCTELLCPVPLLEQSIVSWGVGREQHRTLMFQATIWMLQFWSRLLAHNFGTMAPKLFLSSLKMKCKGCKPAVGSYNMTWNAPDFHLDKFISAVKFTLGLYHPVTRVKSGSWSWMGLFFALGGGRGREFSFTVLTNKIHINCIYLFLNNTQTFLSYSLFYLWYFIPSSRCCCFLLLSLCREKKKSVIWFNTMQLDFVLCFASRICLCSLLFIKLFARRVTKEGIFTIPAHLILQEHFVRRVGDQGSCLSTPCSEQVEHMQLDIHFYF